MTTAAVLASLWPLLLAALAAMPFTSRAALRLAPWAALPAFAVALWCVALPLAPAPALEVPWLLLGARFALDLPGRTFLFFSSLLWLVSGLFAAAYLPRSATSARFHRHFLLAMAGNLGLTVAGDLASFYCLFALLTFASYGLVVHAGGEAMRAGRAYVVLAVLGEALLLAGLVLAAAGAGSVDLRDIPAAVARSGWRSTTTVLLLLGFGVKAGALPLHVWLPLAHPVAPTPASAVLSGTMIKAGLLGWIRVLPLGHADLDTIGATVAVTGLSAAFYGVALGVLQRDPKTALAYSSISQMGFINVALGIGLASPQAWPTALGAILVYAQHHALAKGALFLGVGVVTGAGGARERRRALAGLSFAALAVAGAPLISGAVAKGALKEAAALAPVAWPGRLDVLLSLAAVGSTLLMGRVLQLARAGAGTHPLPRSAGRWAPWSVLLLAVALATWLVPERLGFSPVPWSKAFTPDQVWASTWPLVAGGALLWLAWRSTRGRAVPRPAPGDLLVLLVAVGERTLGLARHLGLGRRPRPPRLPARDRLRRGWLARLDRLRWLEPLGWSEAVVLFLLVVQLFVTLAWIG